MACVRVGLYVCARTDVQVCVQMWVRACGWQRANRGKCQIITVANHTKRCLTRVLSCVGWDQRPVPVRGCYAGRRLGSCSKGHAWWCAWVSVAGMHAKHYCKRYQLFDEADLPHRGSATSTAAQQRQIISSSPLTTLSPNGGLL